MFGSVGPGTRLPSLGHIAYQDLEDALAVQCAGLVAGEVDAFLIETCQDPLQIKAAVNGAKRAREEAGKDIPIIVQVTVETTGTLLVGADIAAAATIIHALDVPVIGLNCATGPREMAEHVKWLGENWPGQISVMPNAGLPELIGGRTHYPLTPRELAQWLERFVLEDGVGIIGGCCGTEGPHIAALDQMLRRIGRDRKRPVPKARNVAWMPSVASLYGQVSLRQENAYLSIGERCNANGSRAFRRLQEAGDWDGCVEMGREQVKEGSHTLDVCTAFVGRDEIAEMCEVVSRMRGAINAPLVIDSTEYPVLEAALKLYGGKAIINSINFEDGEEAADKRLKLAKRFGAAVIALTIDEQGMAKEVADKLRIAERLHDFACNRHGLPPSDLLFDPLTFTICTGNEDDRQLGLNTLDAIAAIRERMPECQIILGLSNISFGLNPPAAAGAEFGVPRPCAAPRADRRDRAFLEDPAAAPHPGGGGAGRRGSDFRPPRRGLRPAAGVYRAVRGARRREEPRRRAARKSWRTGSRSASSTATSSTSKPISIWRCRAIRRSTSSTTSCSAA